MVFLLGKQEININIKEIINVVPVVVGVVKNGQLYKITDYAADCLTDKDD